MKVVTAAEMATIDRRAIQEFGIPALDLMENAGRECAKETADFIIKTLRRELSKTKVTVCCGRGNNGGDGLVVARYLKERNCPVDVFMLPPKPGSGYGPEVLANLERAEDAGIPIQQMKAGKMDLTKFLAGADMLVDAVLGTGASGKPSGEARTIIAAMNRAGRPTVAIDIPSGLDPDTGMPAETCVKAVLTLTLGLPKRGLLAEQAKSYVGTLKVLDIGLPKQLLL